MVSKIALLSDLHLCRKETALARVFNYKFERVIQDLMTNVKPDYVVINGDICNTGTVDELDVFLEIIKGIGSTKLLVTTGNHEFLKDGGPLLERWKGRFGKRLYSSAVIEPDLHFVLLANECRSDLPGAECWITKTQIDWFEKKLRDNPDKDTVVFMHQPLRNTVTPAKSGMNLCRDKEKRLRNILKENQQVLLWFSGHSHCRLGPNPAWIDDEVWIEGDTTWEDDEVWIHNGVTYAGLGATSYMPDPDRGLAEDDFEWCQYRVLETDSDTLTMRTRNLPVDPERWAELSPQSVNTGTWINKDIHINRPSRAKSPAKAELEVRGELVQR